MLKKIMTAALGFAIVAVTLNACGSRSDVPRWEKSPIDNIVKSLSDKPDFSIILYDMDAEGSGSSTVYKHQYKIVVPEGDTVTARETQWYTVSDVFFDQNVNNMGMEIVTKKDGQLKKQVSPAGYNHYVGNEKYGRWTERNGGSFWEFYGKYAFMSSMFNMMAYPARRSYYDDYYGGGYYRSGRPYYGPGGQVYGTKSYTSSGTGKNSTWGNKPSSFKNTVRSRVSRSATNTKTRRSASRSSRSSSYRSRSGGFGK
ncbi:hypothetical protein E1176_03945 [Fulvivirga sp. RKSG066]|uniref:hypothetical protein n=1 Tax=Fulvivirga aurantia TaxID=2529383 RepID=UPI0012BC7E29|nr:hypothetical protein [Fulvivirga aurantia]MTI20162.1 hypothetical protein [Fulvivirga aurantia]